MSSQALTGIVALPTKSQLSVPWTGLPTYLSNDLVNGQQFIGRNSVGSYFNSNGMMQYSATQPRQNYVPDANADGGWSSPGILIEPAATNLFTNSSTASVSSPWSAAQIAALTYITAPDGTNTMALFAPNNVTGSHYVFNAGLVFNTNAAVPAYTPMTFSWYCAAGGLTQIFLNASWTYNLVGPGSVVGVPVGYSSTITYIGNGVYYCTVTYNPPTYLFLAFYLGAYGSYTGNNTNGVYFWGPQLEATPYATSYIPTYGVAVTRAADVIQSGSPSLSPGNILAIPVSLTNNVATNYINSSGLPGSFCVTGSSVTAVYATSNSSSTVTTPSITRSNIVMQLAPRGTANIIMTPTVPNQFAGIVVLPVNNVTITAVPVSTKLNTSTTTTVGNATIYSAYSYPGSFNITGTGVPTVYVNATGYTDLLALSAPAANPEINVYASGEGIYSLTGHNASPLSQLYGAGATESILLTGAAAVPDRVAKSSGGLGGYSLTPHSATSLIELLTDVGSFALTGYNGFPYTLAKASGIQGNYTLDGTGSTLLQWYPYGADGVFALTPQGGLPDYNQYMVGSEGVFNSTWSNATIRRSLNGVSGAFAFTGSNASLNKIVFAVNTGVLTLSGNPAVPEIIRKASGLTTTYTLTGPPATITRNVFGSTGVYSLAGKTSSTNLQWRPQGSTASFLVAGSNAQPDRKVLASGTGSFALTGLIPNAYIVKEAIGQPGSFILAPPNIGVTVTYSQLGFFVYSSTVELAQIHYKAAGVVGSFSLTGSNGATGRYMNATGSQGQFPITGHSASGYFSYKATGSSASYSLVGQASPPDLVRRITGNSGIFNLNGQSATTLGSKRASGNSGLFTINGIAANPGVRNRASGLQGTFAVIGSTAAFTLNRACSGRGSYQLLGFPANPHFYWKPYGTPGHFTLTGDLAVYAKGPIAIGITGSYRFNGVAGVPKFDWSVPGASGAIHLNGSTGTIKRILTGTTSHYSISHLTATIKRGDMGRSCPYILSGHAGTSERIPKAFGTPGSFHVTGDTGVALILKIVHGPTGVYLFTGKTATPKKVLKASGATGSYALAVHTATAKTIRQEYLPTKGAYSFAGHTGIAKISQEANGAKASFVLIGRSAVPKTTRRATGVGSFVLSWHTGTPKLSWKPKGSCGVFHLTGDSETTRITKCAKPAVGTFTLSGHTATPKIHRECSGAHAPFTLTGLSSPCILTREATGISGVFKVLVPGSGIIQCTETGDSAQILGAFYSIGGHIAVTEAGDNAEIYITNEIWGIM